MGMDVAIAKRRLGGQHVVLRICRGSELTGDFDDVSIDGLNGLLLSKNFLGCSLRTEESQRSGRSGSTRAEHGV